MLKAEDVPRSVYNFITHSTLEVKRSVLGVIIKSIPAAITPTCQYVRNIA